MPQVVARIVSGGQTGADRAALDVAMARGIEYGGWCPAGGWAEDLTEPPGLLTRYPNLREADSRDPDVRTRLNVEHSDATLIVRSSGIASPGSDLTRATAAALGRPCVVTDDVAWAVIYWLSTLRPGLTLNVAGPRESTQPGIYAVTTQLLTDVLVGLA